MPKPRLILRHRLALGDTVLMTALARDIELTYPGKYEVVLDTHYREIFDHFPYGRATRGGDFDGQAQCTRVKVSYGDGIRAAGNGQKIHMLAWYHLDFAQKTGIALTPLEPNACLPLSPSEQAPIVPGRYWLLMAGGKTDVTVKIWRASRWQAVVDALTARGLLCVQAGGTRHDCINPTLTGVVNMVGYGTDVRSLFNLIANAEGVICPITAAAHIAAAYDKPCVVIAGGREEPVWEAYTNAYPGSFGDKCRPVRVEHQYLHTVGMFDCCASKGCWKHRTRILPGHDRWNEERRLCRYPVEEQSICSPACLDAITAEHVVAAVDSYYASGQCPSLANAASVVIPEIPRPAPPLIPEISPEPKIPDVGGIDHPVLGGKLTAFVLCYGDHPMLAKTCLGSLLATVPAARLDLRVGLNAVCPETRAYVQSLPVTKIYDHPENAYKYPVMREMLHDPEHPITTPYMLWLDDDANCHAANWCTDLCASVIANHQDGYRMYGAPFIYDLSQNARPGHNPLDWFRAAPWWRNRNLRVRGRGMEAPNGTCVEFAVGWAWAAATEVIQLAGIPDSRLCHNGGDVTIGACCHQLGIKLKAWNRQKSLISCPSREQGGRRGFSQVPPWA